MGSTTRRGVTLIEAIVVVAIIGLLVGILLPAVMKMRERSRRTQCATRLANLGMALHGHLSAYGVFPAGMISNIPCCPTSSDTYYSPQAQLLAYLEEPALADAIDLTRSQSFSYDPAALPVTVPIVSFRCPSDTEVGVGAQRNNYRVSMGPGPYALYDEPGARLGAFEALYALGPSAFRDGLSNTIGMSEKLVGSGNGRSNTHGLGEEVVGSGDGYTRGRDFWYSAAFDLLGYLPPLDQMIEICDSLQGQPTNFYTYSGATWLLLGYEFTWYNHAVPPNSPVHNCSVNWFTLREGTNDNGGVYGASSNHKGGVNCLYMDGAVRFISDDIDLKIWRALSTRSGGEVFGEDSNVF